MKSFSVGDLVCVIDENLKGKVIAVSSHKITIIADDGFEYDFLLQKVTHQLKEEILDSTLEKSNKIILQKEVSFNTKISKKNLQREEIEVDLHIYALTEKYSHMSNYEMLSMQLDKVKEILKNSDRSKIKKIIFIHGKGSGKLKQELEIFFTKNKYVHYPASLKKFSTGATAVEI
jgi:hypothetical protein